MKCFNPRWILASLLFVSGMAAFVQPAAAINVHWTNANGGSWSTATNWDAHRAPAPTDQVFISLGGAYTVTLDVNASVGGLTVGGTGSNPTLSVSGHSLTLGGGSTVAGGTLQLGTGGTVSGKLSVMGALNWTGGTLAGPLTILPKGFLNISGVGQKNLSGTISSSGAIAWSGANIAAQGAHISNSGLFDIKGDVSLTTSGAASSLTNLLGGTLQKSAGTGTTTLGPPVSNSGTVAALSGSLQFAGGYTQSAGSTVLAGGNIAASNAFTIQNGTVSGVGAITGALTNGGTVAPGSAAQPGVLTVNGSYSQTSSGHLSMKIGGGNPGTQYDQLIISGAASLNGSLDVRLTGGFMPTNGAAFQLVTFGSRTGAFAQTSGTAFGPGASFVTTLTGTTVTITARTDTTPPTVSFVYPTNQAAIMGLTSISCTAADETGGSGIGRVTLALQRSIDGLYWNGTNWIKAPTPLSTTLSAGVWSRTTGLPTGPNLKDGSYTAQATAYDRAGNQKSALVTFTIDTVPPTVGITAPANNSVVNHLSSISGFASDNAGGSGLAHVDLTLQRSSDQLYWNGSNWVSKPSVLAAAINGSSWSRSGIVSGPNFQGVSYTLKAVAYDRAGSAASATIHFTADVTAPTVSFTHPTNGQAVNGLASVSGMASDNPGGSGLARVSLTLQRASDSFYWTGSGWTAAASILTTTLSSGSWFCNKPLPAAGKLSSGLYILQATAVDAAGQQQQREHLREAALTQLIDIPERIERFLPMLDEMVTEGLIITIQDCHVVKYAHGDLSTSR